MKTQTFLKKILTLIMVMFGLTFILNAQSPNVDFTRSQFRPVPNVENLSPIYLDCPDKNFALVAPTAIEVITYKTITGVIQSNTEIDGEGIYVITWVYNDFYGNSSTQTQTIIVDDLVSPIPTESTLHPLVGHCRVEVLETPTAIDDCAGVIAGVTNDPMVYTEAGIHIIDWVFDDNNGNVIVQQQIVEVLPDPEDFIAPVPVVENLERLYGCDVIVQSPKAIDNCSGEIIGVTEDQTTFDTEGLYQINWTYTDASGNVATQVQEVKIVCNKIKRITQENVNMLPNPSTGVVNFDIRTEENYSIEIYDLTGSIVYKSNERNISSLDLSHLVKAMYIVNINFDNGQRITNRLILN